MKNEFRQPPLNTAVPLALIAVVFLSLCLPSISVPRLNAEEIDECLFVRQHVFGPVSELPTHGPPVMPGVHVAGRYVPLMEDNDYVGAVELYMQLPFLWVLGNNPFALRLMPIVVSLLGMMAAFVLLRGWFGQAGALGAILLTCTHPVFVHFTRQGHYKEEVFTVALFWLGLLSFQRALRAKRHELLYAMGGGLMFGLGLAHKITFLWYLGACFVAGLVVLRGRVDRAGVTPRQALAAGVAFVVGALPLLVHNAVNGWVTLRLMADRLVHPTPKDDVNNLEYVVNVVVRCKQMMAVIVGGEIWDTEWFGILEGVDVVLRRGWYEGTHFWSPELFRQHFAPRVKELIDITHQAGKLFAWTMSAGIMPLLEAFKALDLDVLYHVDPVQGGADLRVVKRRLGSDVATLGGINSAITLGRGSRDEIRRAVFEAVDVLGEGGGFILSPVDCLFPDTPWESVRAVIEAWREVCDYD